MNTVEFCRRMMAEALARGDGQAASDYETLLYFWARQP